MEKTSEQLIRSALHDMANVLAGVRGIIDLNAPEQPLSQRDRDRLEAVVEEGITTLDRCRHLAMATLPEGALEPGLAWRERLMEALQPMGTLFRCQFDLVYEGAPQWDQWPGTLLRGYAQAVTRQALPYARSGTVRILCSAGPEAWQLQWSPATALPENLGPGHDEQIMDICSRWALFTGSAMSASISWADGTLLARIPRQ